MCFQTMCPQCQKITWGGCGAHVAQALQGVPQDKLCQCQDDLALEPSSAAPRAVDEAHEVMKRDITGVR